MNVAPDRVGGEPSLRLLTFSDLPAIMEIENESYSTPWRESTFEGLLRRNDTDIIGATVVGRLIGYAICWTVGDQAELGNLAVAKSERRRGVGKNLVASALDRVRERGARVCFLEVRVSNDGARSLYEGCGFYAIGRRRDYYAKPTEDAVVMRCDLV